MRLKPKDLPEDLSALGGKYSDTNKEMCSLPATDVASALDTTARYFSCQENVHAALELACKLQAMSVDKDTQKNRMQACITDYFHSQSPVTNVPKFSTCVS